jgi:hypothetical protein
VTAIETSVEPVTVSIVEPITPPLVAVIIVLPGATAVARPAVEMVAVAVMLEAQVTDAVMSLVVASLYVAVAVNCWVVPFAIDMFVGVIAIELSVAGPIPPMPAVPVPAFPPMPAIPSPAFPPVPPAVPFPAVPSPAVPFPAVPFPAVPFPAMPLPAWPPLPACPPPPPPLLQPKVAATNDKTTKARTNVPALLVMFIWFSLSVTALAFFDRRSRRRQRLLIRSNLGRRNNGKMRENDRGSGLHARGQAFWRR